MGVLIPDLNTVKTHLGIATSDTNYDNLLNQLIDQVDEVVANEMDRGRVPGYHPIQQASATEYYDGTGRQSLLLRRRPVVSITRVAVDQNGYYGKGTDAFPTSSNWTEGTDFVSVSLEESEDNPGILLSLRKGAFTSDRGTWPEGKGNILVQYTAGYSTVPKDLQLLALWLVEAAWNAAGTGMGGTIERMRIGDLTYQISSRLSSVDARRILAKYKG